MNEIVEIKEAEVLEAVNRAEIDMQISTAKRYPRNVQQAINTVATYAMLDQETAESCFYVLRRKGSNGQDNVIEGLSVRMAEIIANAWGNLRVATRIIGNDGKMITAQAVCHDLETNVAISKEVKRRITGRDGRTFSEDMQVVTGNAASSIAYRNAVLSVIPKAVLKKVVDETKRMALGQSIDLEQQAQNMVAYFKQIGVTEEQILLYLEIDHIGSISKEQIFELRGVANAIKEGTTTVKETFGSLRDEANAIETVTTAKAMAEKAMQEATTKR